MKSGLDAKPLFLQVDMLKEFLFKILWDASKKLNKLESNCKEC